MRKRQHIKTMSPGDLKDFLLKHRNPSAKQWAQIVDRQKTLEEQLVRNKEYTSLFSANNSKLEELETDIQEVLATSEVKLNG